MRRVTFSTGSRQRFRKRDVMSGSSIFRKLLVAVCTAATILSGCSDSPVTFTEVRRVSEEITASDLQTFFEIVEHLPEKKLPPFPDLYLPLPNWNAERTLPISDLVDAEQLTLAERWGAEQLVDSLPQSRRLDRWLLRKRITREHFVGLTLAIGAALSRSTVRENQDLSGIMTKGESVVAKLRSQGEPFNSLSPEAMHAVLYEAAWITRHDRARRLLSVPEQNVELVLKHVDDLVKLFPAELTQNPFDGIADRLDEQGIPFEELPGNGSFDMLSWDPDDAIVGRDDPLDANAKLQ
jgi:hypothetical protein